MKTNKKTFSKACSKTILSTVIITALLAGTANADQNKQKKGANIDQVISTLQLDATVATNLKSLMESHREQKQALRKQGIKDREQRQTLRKQHRQALLELLGYEKMYEFEGIVSQKRSKRLHRKNNKSKNQ